MRLRETSRGSCMRRRLMRQIYWHQMLGNCMLQLPWIKRTSPVLMHQVRKLNTCCLELYRLEAPQLPKKTEKTAA